jgi:hypothetical protein
VLSDWSITDIAIAHVQPEIPTVTIHRYFYLLYHLIYPIYLNKLGNQGAHHCPHLTISQYPRSCAYTLVQLDMRGWRQGRRDLAGNYLGGVNSFRWQAVYISMWRMLPRSSCLLGCQLGIGTAIWRCELFLPTRLSSGTLPCWVLACVLALAGNWTFWNISSPVRMGKESLCGLTYWYGSLYMLFAFGWRRWATVLLFR